jgi:hypothetical protein
MIRFERLQHLRREEYERLLLRADRGCGYSFANLYIWGRQRAAYVDGYLAFFSQFDRRAVYPFPVGEGEIKPVLDAIIHDANQRGIPCCITGMKKEDCELLERLYPGRFRIYHDRDGYGYVYSIDDLADLKGRKFQRKRNHMNRFYENHPNCRFEELTTANLEAVQDMATSWYLRRQQKDPDGDYHLEQLALMRALADPAKLGMEGLVMLEGDRIVAFSMASRLSADTFDIHFEKAREDVEGAYGAINQAFARRLREKYPEVRYLNREDDMGLEGLRKAKLSYQPVFLVEKYWARLWEEEDEA